MDALKIINLGAEVGLSKKLTLDLYANYNPLDIQRSEDDEDACLPTGASILVL